jgi:hypothetical protein
MTERVRGTTAEDLLVQGTFTLRRAISQLADLPVSSRPEEEEATPRRPAAEPMPEQTAPAPVIAARR